MFGSCKQYLVSTLMPWIRATLFSLSSYWLAMTRPSTRLLSCAPPPPITWSFESSMSHSQVHVHARTSYVGLWLNILLYYILISLVSFVGKRRSRFALIMFFFWGFSFPLPFPFSYPPFYIYWEANPLLVISQFGVIVFWWGWGTCTVKPDSFATWNFWESELTGDSLFCGI